MQILGSINVISLIKKISVRYLQNNVNQKEYNKKKDLELYIADVYHFNEWEKSNAVRVGRNRQEKGEITPYFYAYRVIIPRAEMEKALKKSKK